MIYAGSILKFEGRKLTVKRIEIRNFELVILLDIGRGINMSVYPEHWDLIEIIETNTPKKCKIN